MKTTVNSYDFHRAFETSGRTDNFSYEALDLLFAYIEELERGGETEIELDVVAICCEYTESTTADIAADYSIDLTDCADDEEKTEAVRDYLNDHTSIVGETSDGFVYSNF
jgi:predicted ArsR family transcriptional regulator